MKLSAILFERVQRGFTLIELLVVIAVMGVLATVVLVAVDPVEQFARAEDGNRKQIINTLGNSLMQYYTVRQQLPAENSTWLNALQTSGEIRTIPENAPTSCGGAGSANDNNYCYNTNTGSVSTASDAVVWVALESKSDSLTAGGGSACSGSTSVPYFIFNTATAKACHACGTASQVFTTNATCQ